MAAVVAGHQPNPALIIQTMDPITSAPAMPILRLIKRLMNCIVLCALDGMGVNKTVKLLNY